MTVNQKSLIKTDSKKNSPRNDLYHLAEDIISSAGVGIYIVRGGKFVYVSELYQKITGYREAELLEKDSLGNIYPDDREKVRSRAIKCLKKESFEPYEYRFVRKNGEIIWVLETVASIRYQGEQAALGSFMDINERKRMEGKLQREEKLFKTITDQSSDIIAIINRKGVITYENPAVEKFLGFKANERIGGRGFDNVHPDDVKFVNDEFKRLLSDVKASPSRSEVRLSHKNGNWITFEAVAGNVSNHEAVEALVVNLRDINERKRAEESLRQSEEKYRAIIENIQEGYFEVDLAGNFQFFNDSVCQMLGYNKEELMGMNYKVYTEKETTEKVYQAFHKVFKTGNPTKEVDWQIVRKDGAKIYIEASVSLRKDFSGKPAGFRGIIRDITDRKEMDRKLNYLATHDALTGLPNRMLFMDRLRIALAQSKRNRNKLAVMMLDLDHFKDINDTLGHMVGDKLLKEVSARLTGILRQNDTVARLGGDEFVVLLSDLGKIEYAAGVAEVILKALHKPFLLADKEITSPASIGIAIYPDDCEDIESLLKKSDMAMYDVKTKGRNSYKLFSNIIN